MGFDLMNNFRIPYLSKSITEFWRRWHISLSTWFRDYVYIPLGGSRNGKYRTYYNLFIVFVISGLWHGAAMTFIFWGVVHGLIIVLEKAFTKQRKYISNVLFVNSNTISKKIFYISIIFSIVCFAWIFFRANSFNDSILLIKHSLYISALQLLNYNKLGLSSIEFFVTITAIILLTTFEW